MATSRVRKRKKKPKPIRITVSAKLPSGSKWWTAALLSILIYLYWIPRFVLYSDFRVVQWSILLVVFILVPLAVYKSFSAFSRTVKWASVVAPASVLIVGPTFGLTQGYREAAELKQYGVWTRGIITDKEFVEKTKRGGEYWQIRTAFIANGQRYFTAFKRDNTSFAVGDTVDIIYSSKFPKIHELGHLYKSN